MFHIDDDEDDKSNPDKTGEHKKPLHEETPKERIARITRQEKEEAEEKARRKQILEDAQAEQREWEDAIKDENYIAPNPNRGGIKWYHAFIIPAVWDSLTFIFNRLLGQLAMYFVLPSQLREKSGTLLDADGKPILPQGNKSDNIQNIYLTITTHDGAHLETHEVRNNEVYQQPINQQDYIIHCLGNGTTLDDERDQIITEAEAIDLKCNVVGFNYRNVGRSTKSPRSTEDLVTDLIAQVQRLLDKGVSPGRITLKANSLSGGIATLVTDHFRARGININLFNYRSFSSITNVLVGHIRSAGTGTGYKTTMLGIILGYIAKPIIKFFLLLLRCEIDPVKAYERIDKNHKRHLVVHTSKKGRNRVRPRDDIVIKHYASLDAALTSEERERRQIKKDLKATIEAAHPAESTTQIQALFEEAKKNHPMKARKFVVNPELKLYDTITGEPIDPTQLDAHGEPLKHLVSRYKPGGPLVTGQEYFKEFLQQIHERNRLDEEKTSRQPENKQRYIKIATETITTTLTPEIKTPPPAAPTASPSSTHSFTKGKGKQG